MSGPLPGRQRTQTGAEGGKALYDPYAGIMAITPGRVQTFRRLKDISGCLSAPAAQLPDGETGIIENKEM